MTEVVPERMVCQMNAGRLILLNPLRPLRPHLRALCVKEGKRGINAEDAKVCAEERRGFMSRHMKGRLELALVACLLSAGAARGADPDLPERNSAKEAHEFFSSPIVRSIRVELAESEVEALKKDARKFARATIREGTTVYKDVGLHLKGAAGSFRGLDDKPALTLSFGRFLAGQKFHGLRKIHLNNSVQDSSFLNENLSGELFRAAGVPAARVAYALVAVNGRNPGLYVLKAGFTKDLLELHFKNPTGNLYDMEPGREVTKHLQKDYGEGPDRATEGGSDAVHLTANVHRRRGLRPGYGRSLTR